MIKKIITILVIIFALILAGYGIYRVYNYAVEDATKRIKSGVTEGVGEAINPLNLPKRIFGGK